MSTTKPKVTVKDRIRATAFDLFYRQGYSATGINQIIAESGVAKASFYDHYPSKLDLLDEYAAHTSARELSELRDEVTALPTARERFFGPLRLLEPWFVSTGYRGCPFQILAADAPPEATRVREIGHRHREGLRAYLAELTKDLAAGESDLAGLDVEAVADIYLVLFEGTLATATACREGWPAARAAEALAMCLDHYRS